MRRPWSLRRRPSRTPTSRSRWTPSRSPRTPSRSPRSPTCLSRSPMSRTRSPTCLSRSPTCLSRSPKCLSRSPMSRTRSPTCLSRSRSTPSRSRRSPIRSTRSPSRSCRSPSRGRNDPVSATPPGRPSTPRRRKRRAVDGRRRCRSGHRRLALHRQQASATAASSTARARHRPRSRAVRAARRAGQGLGWLPSRTVSGRRRRLSVTAYAEWALGRVARRRRGPTRHRARPEIPARSSRATRGTWSSGSRVAFLPTSAAGRPPWTADRTEFLGRNGAPDGRPASTRGHRLPGAVGAGLDPCARPADRGRTRRRRRGRRSSCCSARRRRRCERPTSSGALRAADPRRRSATSRVLGRLLGRGPGADARSLDGHPAQPLADLPDARLPRSGRRTAFYQAGGAYGFRDQLQDVIALACRAASSPASTCCGPRPTSSPRATSSTGGIRRPVGASGPGSPTIASGCRTPSIATSRSRATRAVLDEMVRIIEGPALATRPGRRLLPAGTLAGVASLYEHCARGARPEPRGRRARPAADRVGRLERRHEPGRSRGPGRERLAGLVPAHASPRSPRSPRRAASTRAPSAGGPT